MGAGTRLWVAVGIVWTSACAASTSSAEAPYDLAADRQRMIDAATRELGPGTRARVVDDVFVAIAPPGWGADELRASVQLVEGAVRAYRNGRFRQAPSRAIAIYLFPSARPYADYCRNELHEECMSPYGFYLSEDRRMIMNAGRGLGTLTHELVHPFVDADFPSAPIWINEGIASLYEAPVLDGKGGIRGVKNWRLPRLQKALRMGGAPNPAGGARERADAMPAALFAMSDAHFRGDLEDLHYAAARYLCQWLDEHGWLWPFYQRWRDGFASDPSGARAFAEVVGMPPEQAGAAWVRWVRGL